MRMDKLTTKFQMALADAQSLAVGRDHQFIEPAHLMVALLDQDGGSVRSLLTRSGANANTLRSALGEILDGFSRVEGTAGDVQISADLGRMLNVTDKLAQRRGDQFISSELFIIALLEARGVSVKLARIPQLSTACEGEMITISIQCRCTLSTGFFLTIVLFGEKSIFPNQRASCACSYPQ